MGLKASPHCLVLLIPSIWGAEEHLWEFTRLVPETGSLKGTACSLQIGDLSSLQGSMGDRLVKLYSMLM